MFLSDVGRSLIPVPMHTSWVRKFVLFGASLWCVCIFACTSGQREHLHTEQRIESMTVATYNIRHGVGMDGTLDLARTLAAIKRLDADLIALQEVDVNAMRSGEVDQAAWLGERLEMEYAFGSFMNFQGGRYGLAILSRFPITGYTVWTLAQGNEPRVALAAEITPPGGAAFTAVAVHFDWVNDDGFRFTQATQTISKLKSLEMPWIVFGDFNDTPQSRTMKAFDEISAGVYGAAGNSPTFPADQPEIEIDFVLAGPPEHWEVGERTVIDEPDASDHRPVRVIVK